MDGACQINCGSVQVARALKAVKEHKCNRSGEAAKRLREPRAGLVQQYIRADYQTLFGKPLDYSAIGHSRLTDVLMEECCDIIAPCRELEQFCVQVCSLPVAASEHVIPLLLYV